jgi:hypothetical protein
MSGGTKGTLRRPGDDGQCGGGGGGGISVAALGSAMVAAAMALAQWGWRQQRGGCGQLGSAAIIDGGAATVEAAPRAVAGIARQRRWHGCGGSGDGVAAFVVAITRRRRPAWQRGGSAVSTVAAPLWEARRWRWRRHKQSTIN